MSLMRNGPTCVTMSGDDGNVKTCVSWQVTPRCDGGDAYACYAFPTALLSLSRTQQ